MVLGSSPVAICYLVYINMFFCVFTYLYLKTSKHLLILKTSSRRLQNMSWRCFQHIFGVTTLRLEDVLKTSWRHLARSLEDVWKTNNCYAEDVFRTPWRHALKMSWGHVLKTSWRHIFKTCLEDVLKTCLEDVLKTLWRQIFTYLLREFPRNIYWEYLYLTNLNVYVTNLFFANLYLTILRRIQNALFRTQ